jgi:hypothetical protein
MPAMRACAVALRKQTVPGAEALRSALLWPYYTTLLMLCKNKKSSQRKSSLVTVLLLRWWQCRRHRSRRQRREWKSPLRWVYENAQQQRY